MRITMLYHIRANKWWSAWVESWDDQIIAASPAFEWAKGKRVAILIAWLTTHNIEWKVEE